MSRSRHKHKHHAQPHHAPAQVASHRKPKRSAALLMAIFIGLVGLAIAWFASGGNYLWMVGSTAVGVIGGALIGHGIDQSIYNKER